MLDCLIWVRSNPMSLDLWKLRDVIWMARLIKRVQISARASTSRAFSSDVELGSTAFKF